MTSLNLILRLNAASCLGFGGILVFSPRGVSSIVGSAPPALLSAIGAVLLLNGTHLVLASMRKRPVHFEILWFSLGDIGWWLFTLVLIASGVWITTPPGSSLAFLVALSVAGFGIAQFFYLGVDRSGLPRREHWRRICRSWVSLPLWVKIWLFALNAVFLLAPVFLPWESARIVLIAYVASGPLLAAFAAFEGGLTRAMGLAHLLPWAPMLIWLIFWISSSEPSSPALGYAAFLAAMTGICLVFDLYDVWRWARGQRAILLTSPTLDLSSNGSLSHAGRTNISTIGR